MRSLPSGVPDSALPTLQQLGVSAEPTTPFVGGETEAIRRFESKLQHFKGELATLLDDPSYALSPYITHGCISVIKIWHESGVIYKARKDPLGPMQNQLLAREMFHVIASYEPDFGTMEGNTRVKQIAWERDEAKIQQFKEGNTGFPFVDACIKQLIHDGWIHYDGRQVIACFFSRGDLYQHWEEGAKIFNSLMLDADWAINNGNWLWMSASRFYYRYFHCYSPVAYARKRDPTGAYIRKWLPALARIPNKFIYEPHSAPISVQREFGCIIGKDYPKPMLCHEESVKANMAKIKSAYASMRNASASHSNDDDGSDEEDGAPPAKVKAHKKFDDDLENESKRSCRVAAATEPGFKARIATIKLE